MGAVVCVVQALLEVVPGGWVLVVQAFHGGAGAGQPVQGITEVPVLPGAGGSGHYVRCRNWRCEAAEDFSVVGRSWLLLVAVEILGITLVSQLDATDWLDVRLLNCHRFAFMRINNRIIFNRTV
jgi:hypothetical protein